MTENNSWSSRLITPTYKVICAVIGQSQDIKHQTCQKYVKKRSKILSGVHGSARSTVK